MTGTRHGRPDVARWMLRLARTFEAPQLFILGCAPGVDTKARLTCEKHRWSHVVVYADERMPSPDRYHARNQAMVDLAQPGDLCIAFPDDASRGTWDCVRRAKERGLRVKVLPLLPPP